MKIDIQEKLFPVMIHLAQSTFSPSGPIDRRELFSGRLDQLSSIQKVIPIKGRHAVVYGERGVGKTSLVSIAKILIEILGLQVLTVRVNCAVNDTFSAVWKRAFAKVNISFTLNSLGFSAEKKTITKTLLEEYSGDSVRLDPGMVSSLVEQIPARNGTVFIFDEFDRIKSKSTRESFSDLIKNLSDYSVPCTIIVVGIGEDVNQLVSSHESVSRAITEIKMPRMGTDELAGIISKCEGSISHEIEGRVYSLKFRDEVKKSIISISQGLTHYTHLIGMNSALAALERRELEVNMNHFKSGIKQSLKDANHTLAENYHKATSSPHKTLFKEVLLACVLASKNELGYFSAADIKGPLQYIMGAGKKVTASTYQNHLPKFITSERDEVLHRFGAERNYSYRFRNSLMPPFVFMKGIDAGDLTWEKAMDFMSGKVSGRTPKRSSRKVK